MSGCCERLNCIMGALTHNGPIISSLVRKDNLPIEQGGNPRDLALKAFKAGGKNLKKVEDRVDGTYVVLVQPGMLYLRAEGIYTVKPELWLYDEIGKSHAEHTEWKELTAKHIPLIIMAKGQNCTIVPGDTTKNLEKVVLVCERTAPDAITPNVPPVISSLVRKDNLTIEPGETPQDAASKAFKAGGKNLKKVEDRVDGTYVVLVQPGEVYLRLARDEDSYEVPELDLKAGETSTILAKNLAKVVLVCESTDAEHVIYMY